MHRKLGFRTLAHLALAVLVATAPVATASQSTPLPHISGITNENLTSAGAWLAMYATDKKSMSHTAAILHVAGFAQALYFATVIHHMRNGLSEAEAEREQERSSPFAVCLPADWKYGDVSSAVYDYLRNRPQDWGDSAAIAIYQALRIKWPCFVN